MFYIGVLLDNRDPAALVFGVLRFTRQGRPSISAQRWPPASACDDVTQFMTCFTFFLAARALGPISM